MKIRRVFWVLLTLAILTSCDDVLEEDISDDFVQTIRPITNEVIDNNLIQFRWEPLDGADNYRLQLMRADQTLEIDSVTNRTDILISLNPGDYQWRVRGENFASSSSYNFPIDFTVIESSDLITRTLLLLSPPDNLITNKNEILVNWEPIVTANTYTLELLKGPGPQELRLFKENITASSYSFTSIELNSDDEYTWKVKAVNSESETAFSDRRIFLDSQKPPTPALDEPSDGFTTSSGDIVFNWSFASDAGTIQSAINSRLEIAQDMSFTNLLINELYSDKTQTLNFTDIGDYFWRIRGEDEAGNISDYSNIRTLTIN